MSTEHELRCEFCRRSPLLATFGLDSGGNLFVRVKIWKQSRIFGEIIAEGGPLRIRCRECLRWHRVIFGSKKVTLTEDTSAPVDTQAG